ncbi:MAG: IstB ATP binding domain-containing protein, partial [Caulobacteraceae bacterium]
MNATPSAIIDRVKRNLVGLKMPRALEILDVTLRGIERGETTALDALDILLTEELTLRENRRVKMALQMARLSAVKTLAASTSPSSRRSTRAASWRSPNCRSSIAPKRFISSDRPARAKPISAWRSASRRLKPAA